MSRNDFLNNVTAMPEINVHTLQSVDTKAWDDYVSTHPLANIYHHAGWKNVIERTYGHPTYYLVATDSAKRQNSRTSPNATAPEKTYASSSVVGILPLVHIKHWLFGNNITSIPYFDIGGILADNQDAEHALLAEAIKIWKDVQADTLEIRQTHPLSCFHPNNKISYPEKLSYQTSTHKHRMVLNIPESSELLMQSFKSKLRSQIKKSLREGFQHKWGGLELLEHFYHIFLVNMRDLGSPVHSKKMIQHVLEGFPDDARIIIVYLHNTPVAGAVVVGFKGVLHNPWASSLKSYSRMSPNMLLYWRMLEFACDHGFSCFDFGRSSPEEGTYRFKEQWGATPEPLYWHYLVTQKETCGEPLGTDKAKFQKIMACWKKLPVSLTKLIGPPLRKNIPL